MTGEASLTAIQEIHGRLLAEVEFDVGQRNGVTIEPILPDDHHSRVADSPTKSETKSESNGYLVQKLNKRIRLLNMASKKKIIVIGAGFAGLTAASLLGKAGYEVTILEKNDQPGGHFLLIWRKIKGEWLIVADHRW